MMPDILGFLRFSVGIFQTAPVVVGQVEAHLQFLQESVLTWPQPGDQGR